MDVLIPTICCQPLNFNKSRQSRDQTRASLALEALTASIQVAAWQPVSGGVPEIISGEDGITTASGNNLLVALFPSELRRNQDDNTSQKQKGTQRPVPATADMSPFLHVPQCKLEVTRFDELSELTRSASSPSPFDKVERVALPGALVRALLAGLPLPDNSSGMMGRRDAALVPVLPHLDDEEDWVWSRCILTDFTGMSEERASSMSRQGRLACRTSVLLTRTSGDNDAGDGPGRWDLSFMIHRVFEHN